MRTLSAVRAAAETWHHKKKEQQRRTAERAQRRKVEALAGKESQLWQQVTTLIEDKKASSYERAVALLGDLRDLARYQDKLDSYTQRVVEIEQTYTSRSALLRRMRQAKLIG
jgi:seryl-tRNA(Sec) selenium transferase